MNYLKTPNRTHYLIALGLYLMSAINVHANDAINFYLPQHSKDNSELHKSLQLTLNKAGLNFIKVRSTHFWHPYIQGLRQGRPGIYFSAPHLSAWAVNNHQFEPMLRLTGKLQHVLVSRRSDTDIFEVNDLHKKHICTSKAPNLDFILASQLLRGSINSPVITIKKSSSQAMFKDDKSCDAFSISDHIFTRYALKDPYKFIRLHQGVQYPNYAFLSSADISKDTRFKLKQILLNRATIKLMKPLYLNYANSTTLLVATKEDFLNIPNEYLNRVWAR